MHYTINNAFHHHSRITNPKINYIINAALYHQRCAMLSTMHCSINPLLLCQCCITASTENCIIDDAFIHQLCITLPTMSYMIIVELHHNAPLRHQHSFRPAILKIGVIPRWTQSKNAKLYNQILSNQELDAFWSS